MPCLLKAVYLKKQGKQRYWKRGNYFIRLGDELMHFSLKGHPCSVQDFSCPSEGATNVDQDFFFC